MVGGSEILLIIVAVLVLFGAKQLPEIARGLGKGMREIKKATDDIKKEIVDEEMNQELKDLKDIRNDITRKLNSDND